MTHLDCNARILPRSVFCRTVVRSAREDLFTQRHFTLTLSCPDRVGIVAAVARFRARHKGWIIESNNHSDSGNGRFFTRQVILADSLPVYRDEFVREFAMGWQLSASAEPKRAVVLVANPLGRGVRGARQTHH